MKFKVDENLPIDVAQLLQDAGYDAATIVDEAMSSAPDLTVIDLCCKEGRILITLDLDFADIQSYPPEDHFGIIVLRVHRQDKPHVMNVFRKIVHLFSEEQVVQRLWIVEESQVRIHGERGV